MAETARSGEAGLAGRIGRLRERVAALRKALPLAARLGAGGRQALLSTLAAVVAYLPTQALGLREGFWAAITAIAVTQTELEATRNNGRDQFLGASLGGAVGVGVVLAAGQGLAAYMLAVSLAVLACWAVNLASAGRLAAITATILLLVPHAGSPEHMLASRVGEVGWGVAVAIGVAALRARLARG